MLIEQYLELARSEQQSKKEGLCVDSKILEPVSEKLFENVLDTLSSSARFRFGLDYKFDKQNKPDTAKGSFDLYSGKHDVSLIPGKISIVRIVEESKLPFFPHTLIVIGKGGFEITKISSGGKSFSESDSTKAVEEILKFTTEFTHELNITGALDMLDTINQLKDSGAPIEEQLRLFINKLLNKKG